MAVRSKEWVCGGSLSGIVDSSPAEGMDVLSRVSVVRCRVERSLRQADQSSREVLLSVVCVTGYDLVISKMRRLRATRAVEP